MTNQTAPHIAAILALVNPEFRPEAALKALEGAIICALSGRPSGIDGTVDLLKVEADNHLPKVVSKAGLSAKCRKARTIPLALAECLSGWAPKLSSLRKVPTKDRSKTWAAEIVAAVRADFTSARLVALREIEAIDKAEKTERERVKAEKLAAEKAEAEKAAAEKKDANTPEPTATPAPAFDLSDAMQVIEARALMGDVDTLNALQALIAHLETAGILEAV